LTKLGVLFLETRPAFLLLTLVVTFLGTAIAWHDGFFNPVYFMLNLAGLVLIHICVNVLNEYFDYKSGLDVEISKTGRRTPFSGGSGLLPSGAISPKTSLKMGIASLALASPIGVYFLQVRGVVLLPILLIAFLTVVLYTPVFSKFYIGEFLAGLNFGPLAVLGTYIVQTGTCGVDVLLASMIPGVLTSGLLLLNEFPDVEADKKAGRRNLVIKLGKKKAGWVYSALLLVVYVLIVFGAASRFIPIAGLVALLTVPSALKASMITLKGNDNIHTLIPALRHNVIMVLTTPMLLAVGYILDAAF